MSKDLSERLGSRIPEESRPLVARLLMDPLRPSAELVSEVEAYVGFVRAYSATNPGVGAEVVEALGARCLALLERVRDAADDDRRLVQAACLYLVAIEGDLDERGGFDDDEAVIAAVEAALG